MWREIFAWTYSFGLMDLSLDFLEGFEGMMAADEDLDCILS